MENFVVSARKYRPQQFEEVVGQGHVTRTLQNAIAQNHLAQALLFTGPRGVGKTTCARILAKAINSDSAEEDQTDFSFNIFELDAASNNSVDDIRNLIDQVRFAPQVGKYKVYIIDEVHMLSQAAFNAFLKTLEEPPAHAIFILATTEKHKIIPTILSRCQIFDFKRLQVDEIAEHLRGIAQSENIEAEEDALRIIAQKADGALRDALSIFDRIVSFSGSSLTYKDVIENLRILDYDYYFQIVDLMLDNNKAQLMLLFSEIMNAGFDGQIFLSGLGTHFRDLLMCKNPATVSLLQVSKDLQVRYAAQSERVQVGAIIESLNRLSEADYRYKASLNKTLLIELCLLNVAQLHQEAQKKKSGDEELEETAPAPPKPKSAAQAAPSEAPSSTETSAPREKSEPAKQAALVAEEQSTAPSKTTGTQAEESPQQTKSIEKPRAGRNRSGGFSIKQALQKEEPNEDAEEEARKRAEAQSKIATPFEEEKLQAVWKELVQTWRDEAHRQLYNSLGNKLLTHAEGFTYELHLESEIQRSLYEGEAAEILGFLRKKLHNYQLNIRPVLSEVKYATEPYSAAEKFAYMAERNPYLNQLKEQFDIDIK